MYWLCRNGEQFSQHRLNEEAEEYKEALETRYPREQFSIEEDEADPDTPLGRHSGHEKVVWASVGIWDHLRSLLTNYRRGHFWDSEINDVLPNLRGQYTTIRFRTTDENKAKSQCKKHYLSTPRQK